MKTKKRLLPFVAMAVLTSFGLAACKEDPKPVNPVNNDTPTEQPNGTDVEEEEIVVTAAENKKDLLVGETVKLTASVEGVRWSSRSDAVAKVSDDGVVTAMGAGSVKIQAKKDGYKTGSITINVTKAPEKEAKYTIGLEDADHFSPTDIWGMDLSAYGMGFMGPGDSPVENNNGATEDSTSLGWLQAGCKETLTFTSDKAVEVEIGVSMAYNQQMDLNGVLSVKFNGVAISMEGKVVEGPEDGDTNNYYDFHTVSFGKVNLKAENNVLEIEMLQQGPNMDSFKIFTEETLAIAAVKPTAKPAIVVTPTEIEVEVDKTATITTETGGVAYESSDATVASVTDAGVVTGLKVGKATITVSKEGMKKATVSVTVKAKPVAGQVIIEAESAVLPEGTAIQVEPGDTASGGKSLGYISADQSFELKYTAEEAKTYKLSIVFSSATLKSDWSGFDDMEVSDSLLSIKLNNEAVTLGTITVPGGTGWTKVWTEFDLGEVTLKQGENVFTFAATAQAPNIDCIKLTDPNASQGGGGQGGGNTETPVDPEGLIYLEAEAGTLTEGIQASTESGHGGGHIGYFNADQSVTVKFNSNKAGKAKLSIIGSTTAMDWSGGWENMKMADMDISTCTTLTVNGATVDLTGKVFPGCAGMNYQNFAEIDLGEVDVIEGENTIVFSASTQGPNVDCFKVVGVGDVVVSTIAPVVQ